VQLLPTRPLDCAAHWGSRAQGAGLAGVSAGAGAGAPKAGYALGGWCRQPQGEAGRGRGGGEVEPLAGQKGWGPAARYLWAWACRDRMERQPAPDATSSGCACSRARRPRTSQRRGRAGLAHAALAPQHKVPARQAGGPSAPQPRAEQRAARRVAAQPGSVEAGGGAHHHSTRTSALAARAGGSEQQPGGRGMRTGAQRCQQHARAAHLRSLPAFMSSKASCHTVEPK
jgi:hypothetical protein